MTYLYNTENPDGKLFNDDEVEQALKDGWVDTPAKLTEETPKKRVRNGNSKTNN